MAHPDDAVTAFVRSVFACETILAELTIHVRDHLTHGPDEITWSHVAEANRLLDALTRAKEAAGLTRGES